MWDPCTQSLGQQKVGTRWGKGAAVSLLSANLGRPCRGHLPTAPDLENQVSSWKEDGMLSLHPPCRAWEIFLEEGMLASS